VELDESVENDPAPSGVGKFLFAERSGLWRIDPGPSPGVALAVARCMCLEQLLVKHEHPTISVLASELGCSDADVHAAVLALRRDNKTRHAVAEQWQAVLHDQGLLRDDVGKMSFDDVADMVGQEIAKEVGVPPVGLSQVHVQLRDGKVVGWRVLAETVRRLFPVRDLEAVQLEKDLEAINAKRARDSHNGGVGSIQGWEGGRPRVWADNKRWQSRMEEEAKRLIEEGCSDHEIADAVFGDSSEMYRKRIKRFRAHLN
jgi:hypothetical protein